MAPVHAMPRAFALSKRTQPSKARRARCAPSCTATDGQAGKSRGATKAMRGVGVGSPGPGPTDRPIDLSWDRIGSRSRSRHHRSSSRLSSSLLCPVFSEAAARHDGDTAAEKEEKASSAMALASRWHAGRRAAPDREPYVAVPPPLGLYRLWVFNSLLDGVAVIFLGRRPAAMRGVLEAGAGAGLQW